MSWTWASAPYAVVGRAFSALSQPGWIAFGGGFTWLTVARASWDNWGVGMVSPSERVEVSGSPIALELAPEEVMVWLAYRENEVTPADVVAWASEALTN